MPSRGITARASQSAWVEILPHPLITLLFIEQISYREDHSRILTCTNCSHEPMSYDSARERTVLFGGYLFLSGKDLDFGDTWEWDGEDWTQVADIGPFSRQWHSMAYDSKRNRVVLFGGNRVGFLGDTWEQFERTVDAG